MKTLLAAVLALAPVASAAETTKLTLDGLPGKTVYEVATLTPLALNGEGKPLVITLHVEQGKTVPPHATEAGLRLLTVLDGTLYWGDGDTADASAETAYPMGTMLVIKPGENHWLSARDGDVRLQLVVVGEDALTPLMQEQLK